MLLKERTNRVVSFNVPPTDDEFNKLIDSIRTECRASGVPFSVVIRRIITKGYNND